MILPILYQDEFMVAINKPGGLLVHRSMLDKYETQFAMQLLRDQLGQHVYPVHRLDKPTSGVLLFALNSEMARVLAEQFECGKVTKQYLAVVRGYGPEDGELDYPLKEKLDKIADKKAKQDKAPQSAVTQYQRMAIAEVPGPVGRYENARYSLMALHPKTGRKHQLRRHMAHLRHPIIGDTSHGDGKQNRFARERLRFNGLALCCTQLDVNHPQSGTTVTLKADLPTNMKDLFEQLGWQL